MSLALRIIILLAIIFLVQIIVKIITSRKLNEIDALRTTMVIREDEAEKILDMEIKK